MKGSVYHSKLELVAFQLNSRPIVDVACFLFINVLTMCAGASAAIAYNLHVDVLKSIKDKQHFKAILLNPIILNADRYETKNLFYP